MEQRAGLNPNGARTEATGGADENLVPGSCAWPSVNEAIAWLVAGLAAGLMTGCAIVPRHAVPKEVANTAHLPGLSEARIVVQLSNTNPC